MKAIDWFRFNMGLTPRYSPGQTYYKSNIFYAPLIPLRGIYKQVRWQANDPLVHHLISDLQVEQPVGFFGEYPALPNILRPNNRYEPWAYLPRSSSTRFDPTLKDPLVSRSDDWNFPENQSLGGHWLGSVHRGTPWQSIYLKSAAVNAARWQNWLGYIDDAEAQQLHPTNDWRIAGIITSLFNTNPPLRLVSVNNEDLATWTETLGGVEVLTNTISDADLAGNPFLSPQFDLLIMQPTSPQSSTIAAAINNTRASLPGQRFRDLGQILATPQLTFASPWLNTSTNQVLIAINDQAYEKIPSQILSRLRADSLASITDVGDAVQVEFSGVDGYPYAIQTSTNMLDWTSVSTNYPTNGSFNLIEHPPASPAARYYRSVLLP